VVLGLHGAVFHHAVLLRLHLLMALHLRLRFVAFAGFAHKLTGPEYFPSPIVGREFALSALNPTRPSAIGLPAGLAPMLGEVLHGAITEMDDPLLPILASLHHLLLSSPPTLHRLVAWHLVFALLVHRCLRR